MPTNETTAPATKATLTSVLKAAGLKVDIASGRKEFHLGYLESVDSLDVIAALASIGVSGTVIRNGAARPSIRVAR